MTDIQYSEFECELKILETLILPELQMVCGFPSALDHVSSMVDSTKNMKSSSVGKAAGLCAEVGPSGAFGILLTFCPPFRWGWGCSFDIVIRRSGPVVPSLVHIHLLCLRRGGVLVSPQNCKP